MESDWNNKKFYRKLFCFQEKNFVANNKRIVANNKRATEKIHEEQKLQK